MGGTVKLVAVDGEFVLLVDEYLNAGLALEQPLDFLCDSVFVFRSIRRNLDAREVANALEDLINADVILV